MVDLKWVSKTKKLFRVLMCKKIRQHLWNSNKILALVLATSGLVEKLLSSQLWISNNLKNNLVLDHSKCKGEAQEPDQLSHSQLLPRTQILLSTSRTRKTSHPLEDLKWVNKLRIIKMISNNCRSHRAPVDLRLGISRWHSSLLLTTSNNHWTNMASQRTNSRTKSTAMVQLEMSKPEIFSCFKATRACLRA